MTHQSEQLVEHLFRTEYGKLVASLIRIFGTSQIQLAEDMVQDTLISALNQWSVKGIPTNPTGWLIQVAKRKSLNQLKRQKLITKYHLSNTLAPDSSAGIESVFLKNEIEDNQLRMIFICCHPDLKVASRIALTLKTLCGFGVKEVANALLTSESTVSKRLYRAKARIRASKLPFDVPRGRRLEIRLHDVMLTLYLLFNEGYNSTVGNSLIQKELCLEAIRLTKLLVNRFDENRKLCALLALMCFHAARFDARIDSQGAIVLFEDQNRSLWNKDLIHIGMQYLKRSVGDKLLSTYHVEANIAAQHCLADSFDTTDWQSIYDQYLLLEKLKPNPIISLNKAIIQSKLEGLEQSLTLLDQLATDNSLIHYHLLPTTQGVFTMKLGRYEQAIGYFQKALKLKSSLPESNFIAHKISACRDLMLTD